MPPQKIRQVQKSYAGIAHAIGQQKMDERPEGKVGGPSRQYGRGLPAGALAQILKEGENLGRGQPQPKFKPVRR